eukprot:SAG31_NODE_2314_length_5953_cov_1.996413_5_plen_53_part_00
MIPMIARHAQVELLNIGFDDRELELILCGIPKVTISRAAAFETTIPSEMLGT